MIRRSTRRGRVNGLVRLSIGLLAMVLASCDPPGKPKPEPTHAEDVTDFHTLFSQNCAGCHGDDGKNGPGRPLNNALYLAVIPRQTLHEVIENGRPGTAMPAWSRANGGPLTEKQIDALVNGIERNWAKPGTIHAANLPTYSGEGQTGDVDRGRKLFLRDCFMCHGRGAPVGMVTDTTFLQLVSDQMLRAAIIEGRPDLGMPDYRILNMGRPLSDQDITDLVSYMSSLRPVSVIQQQAHTNDTGSGETGQMTKGNEGSGNGPGSANQQQQEGVKGKGSSSQQGQGDNERN